MIPSVGGLIPGGAAGVDILGRAGGDERGGADTTGCLSADGGAVIAKDRDGSTMRPFGTGIRKISPHSRQRDFFPANAPSISYLF